MEYSNDPLSDNYESPAEWWSAIFDNNSQLQCLAVKLFSVSSYLASCEHQFFSLGWFFGKKWQRLSLKTLESLGKVHRYVLSNAKKELGHIKIYDKDYIINLTSLVTTINNDDEYDDLPDDSDLDGSEEESDLDSISQNINDTVAHQLDIKKTVDLEPWVVIDPTFIPKCTQPFSDDDDDDNESDFNVADLVAEEY